MRFEQVAEGFDAFFKISLERIGTSLEVPFELLSDGLEFVFDTLQNGLLLLPAPLFGAVVGLAAWRIVGLQRALLFAAGLLLCRCMNLWEETIATTTLTLVSAGGAVAIAFPLGVAAALNRQADRISRPLMDFMQTMPPYVYLLPGVAFLGFGESTAISTTTIFAIPPALRLTNLGIRQVPRTQIEAGQAFGASPLQLLTKVQIPMALPTIMAGVNQTLMLALAMAVVAGIVGGGGLGAMVYKAIMYLKIAKAFDAGLAIVIVAIIIDRLSQGIVTRLQRSRPTT